MIENEALSIQTIGRLFQVNGKQLSLQYKEFISGYRKWDQLYHASDYVIFKENIGSFISIDETCLSQGELYTIVTNKEAKGKSGALVAMIKGTMAEFITSKLHLIPRKLRLNVKEVTLDLSPSMKLIVKQCFPNATIVSDRFHVQRLLNEAVNNIRVEYRWKAIDLENREIELAKEVKIKYKPHVFENGDTIKQLLSRSRYIVFKHFSKWTSTQKWRAQLLFEQYPKIKEAYEFSLELTHIYNQKIKPSVALTKLAQWYNKIENAKIKHFNAVIDTMKNNYQSIINYFNHRSTNASAESFNAKVKAFRSQFRGVRDIPFFIFRLVKLFA